ncbi:hypothetical protein [Dactylosporangium sp. NPDC051541]|uniref:hypothetical protein n=1 Tax=Dactylosporangium sp. NPDC051541 TaxID=3363977 RepID=UPI00378FB695
MIVINLLDGCTIKQERSRIPVMAAAKILRRAANGSRDLHGEENLLHPRQRQRTVKSSVDPRNLGEIMIELAVAVKFYGYWRMTHGTISDLMKLAENIQDVPKLVAKAQYETALTILRSEPLSDADLRDAANNFGVASETLVTTAPQPPTDQFRQSVVTWDFTDYRKRVEYLDFAARCALLAAGCYKRTLSPRLAEQYSRRSLEIFDLYAEAEQKETDRAHQPTGLITALLFGAARVRAMKRLEERHQIERTALVEAGAKIRGAA